MDEQDAALNQIAAWLADPAPTAEASARMAPLLLSLVVEILVGGRSDEASLGQELRARLHRDPQAKWHLVESLPAWWRKKRVRDGQVDARIFVERCADQVAMLLTFPNFKTVARSGLNLDAVLFRRSGRAIYWSVKRGEHTEEELSHCVEAMLAVADKFEFQNLGAAINYFKKAVRRRLFPRKPKSIQAPVRFRDERVADPQADDEGAPIEEEPEEVAEPKAASLDDSSEVDLTEERQRAWEELQRKLRPKHAVRFRVFTGNHTCKPAGDFSHQTTPKGIRGSQVSTRRYAEIFKDFLKEWPRPSV
jgi:hypothetical protein